MISFTTTRLPAQPQATAPDGTDVRLLGALPAGSFAHFTLGIGGISIAVAHRTVEEIWYVVAGRGEIWRRQDGREEITAVESGVALTIPLGTSFQFRALGAEPLAFVAVTMPPWPGAEEAYAVDGPWSPSVTAT